MLKETDLKILTHLRSNARMTLTKMSKLTSIPVSTIFERIKQQENELFTRHTTLLDFSKLGYTTRATITLAVNRNDRDDVKDFLKNHENINTVYKITNGFDFAVEGVFKDLYDLEKFHEILEEKFKVTKKSVHYIIEEVKKEGFMMTPELIITK